MEQLVGQNINRYRLVKLLGEGGMGAVFKAFDITLQREVAVKIMHAQFARRPDFQERFLQEARTAARLDHGGIVKVFDFGQDSGYLFIVMEYLKGDNLRKLLEGMRASGSWIDLGEALEIIHQVGLALDYAHKNGVFHRDVKPENVMLKAEPSGLLPYRPVVTDLGLAKLAEGGMVTQEGSSMGTPAYMSPEQALGEKTDARSDVYSLGVLLFELATGRLPFPARTISEAIRYHTKEPPPQPRTIRSDISAELEAIILKAMQKDPSNRFPSAKALAESLANLSIVEAKTAAAVHAPENNLATQWERSQADVKDAAEINAFPQQAGGMTQDRVVVMFPDRSTRVYPIKPTGTVIGRGAECDITLDFAKVSRKHLLIERSGTGYRVVDQNSTNGTFMANAKLLPGVPEAWAVDKLIGIGDCWIKLEMAQTPVAAAGGQIAPPGTAAASSQVRAGGGSSRISMVIEAAQFSVQPGGSVSVGVTILNQGPVVDHFIVQVIGVAPEWIPTHVPPIQLMPGATQEVRVNIQPGRNAQSRAGRYPLVIRVTSQASPDQSVEGRTILNVGAFNQFACEIRPSRLKSREVAQLRVVNQGNAKNVFQASFLDTADELRFEPAQIQLQIEPGQTLAADFKVNRKKPRWLGGEQFNNFSAQVVSAEGAAQTVPAEFVNRALLPSWLLPILVVLCLLLASGAAVIYGNMQTQSANLTHTVVAALTQTYDEISRQIGGATATAKWLGEDDDRDGLSNEEEVKRGTLPNKQDTDEDGLQDGQEITYKTDPLKPDTDMDGLKDGEEVNRGINPLKEDTDGDGIKDAQDQDPDATPTKSPTITRTPTPTRTGTKVVPAGGVSLKCDDTYQRLRVVDAGSLGTTVTIDSWNGASWDPVWTVTSGDPAVKKITSQVGFYSFGGCEKLFILPIQYPGTTAVLELIVYQWTGSGFKQVYYIYAKKGTWSVSGNVLTIKRGYYSGGEPSCCPCYTETISDRWNGTTFGNRSSSLTANYSAPVPTYCMGTGGGIYIIPTFELILPPGIIPTLFKFP